ncbi:unnamed protein product [Diatraea saccharalis]|uniref:Uncharacterized protein n=1 Tax=Diatraea saccharalis TaxID=40085 RepID=A0A9N9QUX7_9NEOP|nr:unnamed protein product [Diatraea saccharalis]
MLRGTSILLGCVLLVFIAESSSQRITPAVYRRPLPPPSPPKTIRARRDINEEPLWLYKGDDINRAPATGDHPYLPPYIDDIKLDPNTRYTRSVDSPSAKRGGGSHSTSSSSRNTGPNHPGYNRRNARSIHTPSPFTVPSPTFPRPTNPFPRPELPGPRPIFPVYARHARDVQLSGPLQKPTHYDITFTGFNPNARVQPWQKVKVRTGRDIHEDIDEDEIEEFAFESTDV